MSILFRRAAPMVERGFKGFPYNMGSAEFGFAAAGVYVDSDTAMRHDAVWSCVTRIAQDVSMMPVDVVRRQGRERIDVPSPEFIMSPSSLIEDPMDWRYQVLESWLLDGNAWGIVTKTTPDMRYPLRIDLQPHSAVRWVPSSAGVQFYVNNEPEDLWPVGRLWHKPAYAQAGSIIGLSPIAYHRQKIAIGISAEKFGADFFADGGHPTAILAPASDPGPAAAKAMKERFRAATRGNREVMVVPQDTKYIPIQVSPEDSQFINSMRYSTEQICRVFGEDPADHGASAGGSSITYANRSDADLARFKRRQFWVTKMQNLLGSTQPPGIEVKLNTASSLMMTARERHEVHALRLGVKTTTINAVRAIEDEPPFEGSEYDLPGIPAAPTQPPQGGAV